MQRSLNDSPENPNTSSDGKQNVSLDAPGVTKLLSKQILRDINEYAVKTYFEPHRWHLGASLIGHDCSRYLWYVFRWCGRQVASGRDDDEKLANLGRMQRLFNRGHLEEERFVGFLKGIGAEVWTHTDDGKQYRVSACHGHFGGSLDGVCKLPIRYKIDEPVLLEFKTNNTGRGFDELQEKGLTLAKPQHFIQSSVYGNEYKLRYVLYMNVNKNDESIHVELTKLNWNIAEQMKFKAERIISSQEPPPRLAESPTYHKCAYCDFKQICHFKAPIERNCRSCKFSRPTYNGEWNCTFHDSDIPRDVVPIGCPQYQAIV